MLKISMINREISKVNPEMILFDKDGTLIDIHHYWASMIKLRGALIVNKWFKNHIDKNAIERSLILEPGNVPR